jgi:hypothetical protein
MKLLLALALSLLLSISAHATSSTTTTVTTDWQYSYAGSYGAVLAPWNATGATYSESYTYTPLLPNGTAFTWNFNSPKTGTVLGYNFVSYGDYNATSPPTPVTSQQIENLPALTASHNITLGGNPGSYDTIYDFFTTTTPGSPQEGQPEAHEIVIYAHTPPFMSSWIATLPHLTTTLPVSGITWTVAVNGPEILFMPTNLADIPSVTNLNILALLQYLVSQGVVSGAEYFNGLAFGAEVSPGSGTLAINSFSVSTAAAPVPPAAVSSPNGTQIQNGSGLTLLDSGNKWTLVNGVAQENGKAAGFSSNVARLVEENGVWQENTSNLWWKWTNGAWVGGSAVSPLPVSCP